MAETRRKVKKKNIFSKAVKLSFLSKEDVVPEKVSEAIPVLK